MKARVDAVINDIEKNTASTVLVTGYKREIKYILDLLESKWIGNEIIPTYDGIFGADMKVLIENDGPTTIIIETKK